MRSTMILCLGAVLLSAACGGAEEPSDDNTTDNWAAALSVQEGSVEAAGMISVVNSLSFEELDSSSGVGLSKTAAKNLVSHRAGGDGQEGTADDDWFDTVSEIDGVSGIGTASLAKILDYAIANGFVPENAPVSPFDPGSCSGSAMTLAQATSLFEPGSSRVQLGEYVVMGRRRSCNEVTGCGEWSEPSHFLGTSPKQVAGEAYLVVEGSNVRLQLEEGGDGTSRGSTCSHVGDEQACTGYKYISSYQWGGSGGYYAHQSSVTKPDNEPLKLRGVLTSSCLRLSERAKTKAAEEEYVLFLSFP